jgi:hypothetical protein
VKRVKKGILKQHNGKVQGKSDFSEVVGPDQIFSHTNWLEIYEDKNMNMP